MIVWHFLLVVTYILGYLSDIKGYKYRKDSIYYLKSSKFYYFIAVFLLVFFAGLRSTTGSGMTSIGDTRVYTGLFRTLVSDNFLVYLKNADYTGDWGFYALMTVFKQIFRVNEQGMFFICSLITLALIMYRYYKLDIENKAMLFFLFISLGYYVSTMNGVRQWLVSSVFFLIFPWIKEKKLVSYVIVVLLLSTIHKSALFLLPVYFFGDKQAWGKNVKAMIIFVVLLLITYPVSGPFISSLLQDSSYSQYSSMITSSGGGANIFRVILYVLPIYLCFKLKNKMCKEKYYNIIINISILDMLFMILASTNWIYARLCIYFDPFLLISYLWVLKYLFKKNSIVFAKFIYISVFFLYFCYQMYVGYGGQIYTSQILGI